MSTEADGTRVVLVLDADDATAGPVSSRLAEAGFVVAHASATGSAPVPDDIPVFSLPLADEKAARAAVSAVEREVGPLYGMVDLGGLRNGAGDPAESSSKRLVDRVTHSFIVSREAAKAMRRRKVGRIVTVVGDNGDGPLGERSATASVVAMAQVLARDLATFGITVNVVRGEGEAAAVAHTAAFFLATNSDAITGQVVYLGTVTGV